LCCGLFLAWLFAVLMLAVMVVVWLMKRSVAEKGARVGGE
jgi:hypothetical protein